MGNRKSRYTVLIGFAEALSATEVAWSLVDAGFNVILFARHERQSAIQYSQHVTIQRITAPEKNFTASVNEFSDLLVKLSDVIPGVILPLDDSALWLCTQASLPSNWVVAGACGNCAQLALDKWRQVELAYTAGFKVPESSLASNRSDVAGRSIRYPIIVRPSKAVVVGDTKLDKGGNWICSDEKELESAFSAWGDKGSLLVQPFLRGMGEGVFGLAARSGIVAWSAHRRMRMMNPHGSGSSACVSQAVPDDVKKPIEQFIRASGWSGLFMIELLRDHSGALWFIEFNGRAWGSMALARRQGLEYAAWTVQLALDPAFSPVLVPLSPQPIECRNFGREIMHLLFILRGSKSKAIHNWPSFWHSVFDVLHFRRGSALHNWRRDDWKVFFADSFYTVRDQVFKR